MKVVYFCEEAFEGSAEVATEAEFVAFDRGFEKAAGAYGAGDFGVYLLPRDRKEMDDRENAAEVKRALAAIGDIDSPGDAVNAEGGEVPTDADRARGRSEERAAIVAFLRAEAAKFDKASHDRTLPEHSQERCSVRAALLETEIGYITRGDHEVSR